jgi:hypothetical protein
VLARGACVLLVRGAYAVLARGACVPLVPGAYAVLARGACVLLVPGAYAVLARRLRLLVPGAYAVLARRLRSARTWPALAPWLVGCRGPQRVDVLRNEVFDLLRELGSSS